MSWKTRTVLATGAGVALVTAGVLAVANAVPEPSPVPLSEPSTQVDDLRGALDGLLAEVEGLESAVAAGAAPTVAAVPTTSAPVTASSTPSPTPTPTGGRDAGDDDHGDDDDHDDRGDSGDDHGDDGDDHGDDD